MHLSSRALLCLLLGSVLSLSVFSHDARATECTCLWQGPFVEVQGQADLVVRGEVVSRKGNAIDIAVRDVLRGEFHAETVRIWGDYPAAPADSCRAPVEPFAPGTEWVLALQQLRRVPPGGFNPDTPNISFGLAGDFTLSRCGATWLEVRDDFARGNLANTARWQYEDEEMEPVDIALLQAWLRGDATVERVIEAARPNPEARRLRRETLRFLYEQRPSPLAPAAPSAESLAPDLSAPKLPAPALPSSSTNTPAQE